jgi:hypothetical protein
MTILADLNNLTKEQRLLAAEALFRAELALNECGHTALKEGNIELSEAIGDLSTLLTATAQMFIQGDGPPLAKDAPERVGLFAIAMLYHQSLNAQVDAEDTL